MDGIGKPVGHGVPRCLVQRSREVSASDFDVAPLLSASDAFDRHFCDAFAVAIDEFYKVSNNVVLLKQLVQTHAIDDLNRAAADIDTANPAAKADRHLDTRNDHAVTGNPIRGHRPVKPEDRQED